MVKVLCLKFGITRLTSFQTHSHFLPNFPILSPQITAGGKRSWYYHKQQNTPSEVAFMFAWLPTWERRRTSGKLLFPSPIGSERYCKGKLLRSLLLSFSVIQQYFLPMMTSYLRLDRFLRRRLSLIGDFWRLRKSEDKNRTIFLHFDLRDF